MINIGKSVVFVLLCSALPAAAAVMIQPVNVSSTTPLFNTTYQLTNLINKDGLSQSYTSGVTDYQAYLALAPTQASNPLTQYAVQSEAQVVTFDFDLGATYQVSQMLFWNGPASASSRVASFTVSISNTSNFAVSQSLGSFTSSPSAAHPVAAEGFNLTPGTGRYIRMTATNAGGIRTLTGEVAFAGAVPEPGVALLAGLGLLATTRRRNVRAG